TIAASLRRQGLRAKA
ncbi:hypothetical protein, partial [Salmonella enterica]